MIKPASSSDSAPCWLRLLVLAVPERRTAGWEIRGMRAATPESAPCTHPEGPVSSAGPAASGSRPCRSPAVSAVRGPHDSGIRRRLASAACHRCITSAMLGEARLSKRQHGWFAVNMQPMSWTLPCVRLAALRKLLFRCQKLCLVQHVQVNVITGCLPYSSIKKCMPQPNVRQQSSGGRRPGAPHASASESLGHRPPRTRSPRGRG